MASIQPLPPCHGSGEDSSGFRGARLASRAGEPRRSAPSLGHCTPPRPRYAPARPAAPQSRGREGRGPQGTEPLTSVWGGAPKQHTPKAACSRACKWLRNDVHPKLTKNFQNSKGNSPIFQKDKRSEQTLQGGDRRASEQARSRSASPPVPGDTQTSCCGGAPLHPERGHVTRTTQGCRGGGVQFRN